MIKKCLFSLLVALPLMIHAQEHQDSAALKPGNSGFENRTAKVSAKDYVLLLESNFKQQATAPLKLTGRQWLEAGGVGLITAGVILSDKGINHAVNNIRNNSTFIQKVSPVVTKFGGKYELITLASLEASGLILKNEKLKATTLMATQAYLLSGIWVSVIKFISGRERPNYYNPQTGNNEGNWHGAFFKYRKNAMGYKPDGSEYSSFASGHATVAFAVATVFAKQYSDKPVVQIISYSAASLVGLSRMTENKHWASDVLVGAAFGYFSGRQVVKNYHRFVHSKLLSEKRNKLTFNLNYNHGLVMPGLTYTFR